MKNEMQKYTFVGSVTKFDILLCSKWEASTYAPTKEKAISNLKYRFKKENGIAYSVPVQLVGTVSP